MFSPEQKVTVIIPARNEAAALPKVLGAIPSYVNEIIVVDNGSTDGTSEIAQSFGAKTVYVETPGYGRACLAGIRAALPTDIIVFLDGDASDYPEDMDSLLAPIWDGSADFVIGSRLTGDREKGSLTLQQSFGNWLACFLMKLFWKSRFTDLGPFRAIRTETLAALNMEALTYGWTVEMQVRALKKGVPYSEVPVRYRKRIGVSKISGTVRGVILAGYYILSTIFIEKLRP
jgi:glycosyltransferase involved in cell wall biosynthesis